MGHLSDTLLSLSLRKSVTNRMFFLPISSVPFFLLPMLGSVWTHRFLDYAVAQPIRNFFVSKIDRP